MQMQSSSIVATTADRRCGPRVSINLPIKVLEPLLLDGKLIDLSLCGCGILMSEPLSPNSLLTVHLSLPSEDGFTQIALKCSVARCNKIRNQYLTGLSFDELKPHQSYEINAFFHYHRRFSA
ncbi:PilZ domain-containing protein [Thiosulfatimonas sediminis]|uniref:PilZ domain-containing protein n=1 Tax=Thiosulfatimonas sediminis TaxID=2675054 RepID=UPI001567851F|nr:PilZ domain-containing protein [Thiosulfatimonas sediminis]